MSDFQGGNFGSFINDDTELKLNFPEGALPK